MADGIATLISSVGLTQETFLVFCILAVLIVGHYIQTNFGHLSLS